MIVVIVSSCSKNPVERNTIVFEAEIRDVQDSLITMMKLLTLLPKRSDNLNINYTIKRGKLYANYSFLKDSIIEVGNPFSPFGGSEKKDFTSLAIYLNKNHISSAYFDESSSLWRFIYRDIPDITYNDSRDIVVLSNKEAKPIELTDKILDKKDRLYLVAPIDAKIR